MLTWQRVSRGADLHKDGLALQAVLHRVDTDVIQLPGHEVAQGHRRRRVWKGQLVALAFERRRVDDSIACVKTE